MKFQQVLDFVITASGISKSRIGIAYTKATTGLFTIAELGAVEYLGENGVYGLGRQRRASTTVNLTITHEGKEGNPKIYALVANEAEIVAKRITDYKRGESNTPIDYYVSSINFDASDETGQEQVISATVSVVVEHDAV